MVESTAITIARAHIEAWSSHDWDKTRELLSPNIHAIVITTHPARPPADFTGIENYMERKIKGAQHVEPGSVNVISAIGDENNALILCTFRIGMGPGGAMVTMARACIYMIDENKKIKEERDEWFLLSQ